MISRYRVSLGNVELDSLDDRICILDIQSPQPEKSVKKVNVANLPGYEIADEYIGQRNVNVTFELHIYDIAERNAVCQAINAWASNGGTLRTNDREGQRLEDVVCEQYADITAKNWTEPLTLVFATTYRPHWMSEETSTRTLNGKNTSGVITLDGNVGNALVLAEITANASVTAVQITVGSTMLKLTGLSLSTGQKLVIDYLHNRYLRIKANGSSVLTKLDSSSSDNLLAKCGADTSVAVSASASVRTVLTARGCWL